MKAYNLILLCLLSANCMATEQGPKFNFSATVVAPPPCKINGDNTIKVDFGDVGISHADGEHYKQNLNIDVKCDASVPKQLLFKVIGTAASFNSSLLATSNTSLGIKFFKDKVPLEMNKDVDFDNTTQHTIEAAPLLNPDVSDASSESGSFSAEATLVANYS